MVESDRLFLNLGYVPSKPYTSYNMNFFDRLHSKKTYESYDSNSLIEIGHKKLSKAILSRVIEGKLNVVPLSGGYDSRLILESLIKIVKKNEILTVTYGSKKSIDVISAREFAKKIGVENVFINLEKAQISLPKFKKLFEINPTHWNLDVYYNNLIYDIFGKNVTYWSGFMGDIITGSKSHMLYTDWSHSLSEFLKDTSLSNTFQIEENTLSNKRYFPQKPIIQDERVNYYEQHYLSFRQNYYIEPILINKNYDIKCPFYDKDVINFFFNLPKKYRYNQRLLKNIIETHYFHTYTSKTSNLYMARLCDSRPVKNIKKYFYGLNNILQIQNNYNYINPSKSTSINHPIYQLLDLNSIKKFSFDHQISYRKLKGWDHILLSIYIKFMKGTI